MNFEILYLILVPALTGLFLRFVAKQTRVLSEGLAVLAATITFFFSARIALLTMRGEVLTLFREQFRVDALSGLITFLVGFISLIVIIYSIPYIRKDVEEGRVRFGAVRFYYAWIMFFISSMLWATTTNNIILLWVIIEATTLTSVILVAYYWNRDAVEAGYKYAMLLTVGITFALFGCVLLYSGASPHIANGIDPLKMTAIAEVASKIPKSIALLSVVLLLVGFGTKAGIVPFHTWLPDAHAEAPTPVSALLSGVMIKVGIYAVIRTVLIFYPVYEIISSLVLVLGAITMVVGVLMMFLQEDLKRFLAFCSVSSMGYIVMGLGLGNYLGIYGAIFHLLNHSLMKALAFLSIGGVIYSTGCRRLSDLGGLAKFMPITAFTFWVAALALGGVPLFNGFMSEFTLFLAGVKGGHTWATVIAILVAILTLAAFVHVSYHVFMGKLSPNLEKTRIKEIPITMWGGTFILAVLCIVIGIYPQIVYPFLNEATKAIFSFIPLR
jgi:hydrogenase-4 component F